MSVSPNRSRFGTNSPTSSLPQLSRYQSYYSTEAYFRLEGFGSPLISLPLSSFSGQSPFFLPPCSRLGLSQRTGNPASQVILSTSSPCIWLWHAASLCSTFLSSLCPGPWSGDYRWTPLESGSSVASSLLEACECFHFYPPFSDMLSGSLKKCMRVERFPDLLFSHNSHFRKPRFYMYVLRAFCRKL